MLRRPLLVASFALAGSLASAQNPPPAPPQNPPPAPAPDPPEKKGDPAEKKSGDQDDSGKPPVIVDNAADAAALLKETEKGLADKEPRARADALEKFIAHRNEGYVKVIAPLLHDKNNDVAKTAARALGNQPFKESTDALLAYATNPKLDPTARDVAAEAILALGSAGLGKKGYEKLREIFDNAEKPMKTAICRAFAEQKEKKAFSFFVDHTDEPQGKANDPSNTQPASWWKARFEEWNDYKQYVRKGLKELTGQSLATAQQYKDWAAGPGKKLGFAYKQGT